MLYIPSPYLGKKKVAPKKGKSKLVAFVVSEKRRSYAKKAFSKVAPAITFKPIMSITSLCTFMTSHIKQSRKETMVVMQNTQFDNVSCIKQKYPWAASHDWFITAISGTYYLVIKHKCSSNCRPIKTNHDISHNFYTIYSFKNYKNKKK